MADTFPQPVRAQRLPPRPARPARPRRRILAAALELVSAGGYDALQVRALSERANVSSRTIYSYFESLDSLLIVAIAEQSQGLYGQFIQTPPTGRTAMVRVRKLIAELTGTMTANRNLTVALLRALLSGKDDVVPFVRGFAEVLEQLLASAIARGQPTRRDRETAEILQCVWFSSLIGWATGTVADTHVNDMMEQAARRLVHTGS